MGNFTLKTLLFLALSVPAYSAELSFVNSAFEAVDSPSYTVQSEIYVAGLTRITPAQNPEQKAYRFLLRQRAENENLLRYGIFVSVKDSTGQTHQHYVLGSGPRDFQITITPTGEVLEFAIFADYGTGSTLAGVLAKRVWYKNRQDTPFSVLETFKDAESNYISVNGNTEEYPLQTSPVYWGRPL